ncbi:Maf family protein [Aquabacter spiritensis]|uniref:Nucleoside triphosphate pyrophosphatase n=1 Tax=Aquabacter spiritensis TaxID=933073 RepID=A0A4R3M1A9_9HYPH|nr:Maf family protein [Aquabacter spiritensis]TCT05959.1 septum formation protein [Aquabacter spiritensis]
MSRPGTGLWRGTAPLALASRSAVRRALLEAAGLPVETVEAVVDERRIEADAPAAEAAPDDIARILARAKAFAGAARVGPERYVLGADQTLALGGTLFHKAPDRAAAALQLSRLAGRTHVLHAALCVVRDEEILFEALDCAALTMRPLSAADIEDYLDAAGPAALASVGCYQLEALGVHLFERIEGDHFTILGLPLLPLLGFLRGEELLP